MVKKVSPFSGFEQKIAWRYLRARRTEGGVSVMTWISLIGIALAVFAMIATLSVRAGFRAEFVDTILGANAHVTVYSHTYTSETGEQLRNIPDYQALTERLRDVPGITRAAPLIRGEVLANRSDYNAGAQVYGITKEDLMGLPRIADPQDYAGSLESFEGDEGIAIGSRLANELGAVVGTSVLLLSPDGPPNPLGGQSTRRKSYVVGYIFQSGRYEIDRTRIYMPFKEAQSFFNSEGAADEIEVMVEDPETVASYLPTLQSTIGLGNGLWTWLDASGDYLRALKIEDNVMFVLMSVLVLIAAMNIVSGLIMLVKNKGRDIGILRTMGLTEGSVLRIFFLCGAFTGIVGTIIGVALGCLFTIYIDQIFGFVNYMSGGEAWDPSIRGIYFLPAKLQFSDVSWAVGLSLFLSFFVTYFPARRAARMNPVEALRYE